MDLGLKFAPKKSPNKFDTYIEIQKFVRNISIKKFFALNPGNRNESRADTRVYSHLQNKSIFNPKILNNRHVEMFKDW